MKQPQVSLFFCGCFLNHFCCCCIFVLFISLFFLYIFLICHLARRWHCVKQPQVSLFFIMFYISIFFLFIFCPNFFYTFSFINFIFSEEVALCEAASSVLVYQGRTLHSYCPPALPKANTQIQKFKNTKMQDRKRHLGLVRLLFPLYNEFFFRTYSMYLFLIL